jgi:hypothetical protein
MTSAPETYRTTAAVAVTAPGLAQPTLGLAGLLLVVPIAAALAIGAGGADDSVLVLGPLVASALPVVAMVAFWWEDWPGTRLRAGVSGWVDTLVIAVGALLLTLLAQSLAGAWTWSGCSTRRQAPATCPRSRPRCRSPARPSWRCWS